MTDSPIHQAVRERYGTLARSSQGCCSPGACCDSADDPISSGLYTGSQVEGLPASAVTASLGCGNPTALIELHPGDVVLDLGSGAGLDVLLSARRVGPTGKAYGLDMTAEMLGLARDHQRRSGLTNAEFLEGRIEAIPLPDNSVDVVISNCVINLSPDKDAVLREAFRVIKPGGRFAVSDIVVRGRVPEDVRRSLELWVGCIAGALEEDDYRGRLVAAGFEAVEIEPWRVYDLEGARAVLDAAGLDANRLGGDVEGRVASAFIRATKPPAVAG
jgi:arsenite methyltransferase